MMKNYYGYLFGFINTLIYIGIVAVFIVAIITAVILFFRYPAYFLNILACLFIGFAIIADDKSIISKKIFNKKDGNVQRKKIIRDGKIELYKTLTEICLLIRYMTPFAGVFTMGLAILFPIMSLCRYFKYPEQIKITPNKEEKTSTLENIILISGAVMLLWGIEDHLYPLHFWIIWIIVTTLFIIPFFTYTKEYKSNYIVALKYCAIITLFSFGLICTVNSEFDFSKPMVYQTTIIDKHKETGRHTRLYLIVKQGDFDMQVKYYVNWRDFTNVDIGDDVTVEIKEGLLKFEWYNLNVK